MGREAKAKLKIAAKKTPHTCHFEILLFICVGRRWQKLISLEQRNSLVSFPYGF
jgi:hypothetical protein